MSQSSKSIRKETGNASHFRKYSKSSRSGVEINRHMKPSEFNKSLNQFDADEYPKIIEFNNIADHTSQVHSTVDVDQPLFQPSPKIVIFENYAPFSIHEKKLFFRNNDSVTNNK